MFARTIEQPNKLSYLFFVDSVRLLTYLVNRPRLAERNSGLNLEDGVACAWLRQQLDGQLRNLLSTYFALDCVTLQQQQTSTYTSDIFACTVQVNSEEAHVYFSSHIR